MAGAANSELSTSGLFQVGNQDIQGCLKIRFVDHLSHRVDVACANNDADSLCACRGLLRGGRS